MLNDNQRHEASGFVGSLLSLRVQQLSGFMVAAPFALIIRSPGHIYVLITNVNNTYVLVKLYYKYVSK